jgi:sugar O-acyltransferase (sialic acid O-acetyltransferase NeuD family)
VIKILIHGTGTAGKLLYFEMLKDERYEISAFVCDDKYFSSKEFLGKPLYKTSEIDKYFLPKTIKVISTGSYSSLRERYNSYLEIKKKGYSFINYISKKAIVQPDIEIGENNIIYSGVYLDFFGKLGDCNIIRPNTYIGHNFDIESGVYIAPGCNIAGYSVIKELSFIGIGSTIKERICVEKETLIGAGALLTKNTEPYSKYIGSPAKKISEHKDTGVLL